MAVSKDAILFEVSWEVCNKVGGINTVLRSKAAEAVKKFGDNYFMIGPHLSRNTEFEETDEPCWREVRRVLGEKGFECRFGRWAIPSRPKVILVKAGNRYNVEQLLFRLWEGFGVDSIAGGWDYIEPVLFSTACGEVVTSLAKNVFDSNGTKIIAQFHEWMTGAGLLYVKENAPAVATTFTTHATILGRSMTGAGRDIYQELTKVAPLEEAKQCNVAAKHSMELTSAREADCFTTVSELTAREAHKLLGTKPVVVTENGVDVAAVPDYTADRQPAEESRARLLAFARDFLGEDVSDSARLVLISGRYEFGNKGIDVFLESLAQVRDQQKDGEQVIALICVLGPHLEHRVEKGRHPGGQQAICTHRLPDENNDPILRKCLELGISNQPGDKLRTIFVPVYLSAGDGVLDMHYYDVLRGVDLTIFPSQYEPWGYTPLESALHAVPTVTTDLAGFGLWVREICDDVEAGKGVFVVDRLGQPKEAVVNAVAGVASNLIGCDDQALAEQRAVARRIGEKANWQEFYAKYLEAYELALRSMEKRAFRKEAIDTGLIGRVVAARVSTQPHFRTFIVEKPLPERIARLRELAYNLWWSWHPEGEQLFARIDPYLWENHRHSPLALLDNASNERLAELAESDSYLSSYDKVMLSFDTYMKASSMATAVEKTNAISWNRPVAYFSMEFGIHESLPLYSGGLGVLSGDHLKSASDLNIPLVAVGLFYTHGYFQQRIDAEGNQVAEYPVNDVLTLPIRQLQADDETPITVSVELPGRTLYASIWKLEVGRITVYLLHTDVPANTAQDRNITDQLYVGDERVRIEQEILLGIGGARALYKLGINPSVYHLNEGHSAFITLEHIREAMKNQGMSFDEAHEMVKTQTVFTTHTPVEAGNERFGRDLMQYYFAQYFKEVGVTPDRFFELGRAEMGDRQPFVMTILALKMACLSNGVSKLHGVVSRRMWERVWSGAHRSMVPIGSITNGVHVPSFIGPEMRDLLDTYLGLNWDNDVPALERWDRLDNAPDNLIWEAKLEMKQRLMVAVRDYVAQNWYGDKATELTRDEVLSRLRSSTLTIGFARRFAPYKRATLLFSDLDRLDRIVNNPRRPVQFLFAGKAHPKDHLGGDLVKQVVKLSRDKRFAGRIIFLENYDLNIAKLLVQGVDIWLNTPRRPYEASGTSGQKACINGGINMSVADGWWYEGAEPGNGWVIGPGPGETDEDTESDDRRDALDLYSLLEDTAVPLYYQRSNRDIPERWLAFVRNSIKTCVPKFNTHRMVADYFNQMYKPCAERAKKMQAANGKLVRQLSGWKQTVYGRFSTCHLIDITTSGIHSGCVEAGKKFTVRVRVDLGEMKPDELAVELIVGQTDLRQQIRNPEALTLKHVKPEKAGDNVAVFTGEHIAAVKGNYSYGIRILPYHKNLVNRFDLGLIVWA